MFVRASRTAAAAAVAALAVAATALPAHAAPGSGIGTGRAVIHIDAKKATVTSKGGDSYTLTLPKGSTGQWMGERTNAQGKVKTRVGTLTGEQLAAGWSDFQYGKAGADATLTWDASKKAFNAASVHISAPRTTSAGVVVDLTSSQTLPATLNDVSLSIARAPGKGVRSLPTQKQNVTSDLWISNANSNASTATARIYNSTNNNTCFSHTTSSISSASVGSNTCDNIAYTDYSSGSSPFGVDFNFSDGEKGNTFFNLSITPPGASSYHFSWKFSWAG